MADVGNRAAVRRTRASRRHRPRPGAPADRLPTVPVGLLEIVRPLPVPPPYEAVVDAGPLTGPVSFRAGRRPLRGPGRRLIRGHTPRTLRPDSGG